MVLLYTETFGNPRKFARIARRVSRRKPIVAVRAGGSVDPTTEALYEQAGVIRVRTVRELFDTARVLDGAAAAPRRPGDGGVQRGQPGHPGPRRGAAWKGCARPSSVSTGREEVLAPLPAGASLEGGVLQLTHRAMPADYAHAVAALLAQPMRWTRSS